MSLLHEFWEALRQHLSDPGALADRYRASIQAERRDGMRRAVLLSKDSSDLPPWRIKVQSIRKKIHNPYGVSILASCLTTILFIFWPNAQERSLSKTFIPILILFFLIHCGNHLLVWLLRKLINSNVDVFLVRLFVNLLAFIIIIQLKPFLITRTIAVTFPFLITSAVIDFCRSLDPPRN